PEELKSHLQKALDIASGLDNYLEKITTKESEPLAELYKYDFAFFLSTKSSENKSWVCFLAGQALKMLIHMSQAKRVLEIGMFTGYGALSMAEGLPEDGCLVACELEPYLKEFSQPIFEKSPHGKKITVKIGSAMETLKELAATGDQFDMVFIDADKNNYITYYNFIMDNNLLRPQGVICVDNSLFKARVYLKDTTDSNGLALRDFNQFIANDPRVEQVIIPLRDGISLIRRDDITDDEVFRGVKGRFILDRMRLDGKVAYVTGGGQGIGRGFAHALGEAGAKVAVVDMDQTKAETVVKELLLKGVIHGRKKELSCITPKKQVSQLVHDFVTGHNIDVMFLTETWLDDNNKSPILIESALPNYMF
uniref:O-methyltransferase MdmC-like n=1 Tax=Poecilia latipinna TaxID=48699 RepID=A0A3B3UX13_9TELE